MLISFSAGYWSNTKPPKVETKIVTEVQERERVVTRSMERPDGTKETIVVETRAKNSTQNIDQKITQPKERVWSASISAGRGNYLTGEPVYSLGVARKLLPNLSLGLYARTDRELGATLILNF